MRKFLQRLGIVKPPRPPKRSFLIGHKAVSGNTEIENYKYPDNRICSSRYTLITFIPKNLFEQFQRIANFYFLCVAIIQLFIDTPVTPATSILPLVFVLFVTAVKQGYEDYLRHRADNEVNNQLIRIVRDGKLMQKKAMEITVGDVVYCQSNETFPCDLIMLSSSDPCGDCYVTTASLDGETNLKTFSGLAETKDFATAESIEKHLRAYVECQQPIDDLYKFLGRMVFRDSGAEELPRPISASNVLLRGARLKNTEYIFGCAVYTGPDTKMALNSKEKVAKVSRVENRLNYFLAIYLIFLLVESAISTGLLYIYRDYRDDVKNAWYIPGFTVTAWRVVQDIFGFVVLYNYLIPISLYVTIELQKFFGSMFFEWDLQMYDEKEDHPAKANTSDLNEELGQIEFLFSDKTGTLTENEMQFRQCCVSGVFYSDVSDRGLCECMKPTSATADDQEQLTPLSKNWCPELENFFVVLSLCHTVRLERRNMDGDNPGFSPEPDLLGSGYEYVAASPDEKAFVEAGRKYGYVFHGKEGAIMTITVNGEKQMYEVHHILEFDSDRKCMSVVIRSVDDGSYRLLCKGAESSMLTKGIDSRDSDYILEAVNAYAMQGLRTLVIAERRLSPQEFHEFDNLLEKAKLSDDRDAKMVEAYAVIENNLKLIGCTGIEDQLQDGVKETIEDLRKAGVQVWVLTGDKEETAVNISYSAGHFASHMQEIRLTRKETPEECYRALKDQRKRIKETRAMDNGATEFAIVVDGQSLIHLLQHPLRDYFLAICIQCNTVLCCRMTPLQKAEVVGLVRGGVKPEPVTAAVGDGANDVSMIQEAHVGFGIYGKEGRQAVRASDYAFGRFRFLRTALFMHGHLYYVRISILVQYFFYKNITFITAEFWFAIFSAWSATTIYDSIILMLYNLTFTSLPILLYGVFEQHIDRDLLLKQPELYKTIARNERLSWGNFLYWNLSGLWHSIVSFFGVYIIAHTDGEIFGLDGLAMGLIGVGTYMLLIVLAVVTAKLMLCSYYLTWITLGGLLITLIGNGAFMLLYCGFIIPASFLGSFTSSMYWVIYKLLGYPSVWLGIVLLTAISLLPDIIFKVIQDQKLMQLKPKVDHSRMAYAMNPVVSRNSVQDLPAVTPNRITRFAGISNPSYDDKDGQVVSNGNKFYYVK